MLWAQTVFGDLEDCLPGTFKGSSRKHLQRDVDAFSYSPDRRWRTSEVFRYVLRRAVGGQPLQDRLPVPHGMV